MTGYVHNLVPKFVHPNCFALSSIIQEIIGFEMWLLGLNPGSSTYKFCDLVKVMNNLLPQFPQNEEIIIPSSGDCYEV